MARNPSSEWPAGWASLPLIIFTIHVVDLPTQKLHHISCNRGGKALPHWFTADLKPGADACFPRGP